MTTMSLDATLARITAIQSQLAALGYAPAVTKPSSTSVASPATSSTFAAALGSATAQPAAGDPAMPANLPVSWPTAASLVAPSLAGPAPATGSGTTGSAVVASAEKYLGVPYVFGGTTTSGLDCSGLVQKAYGDLGISLPRVAADQAHVGVAVPGLAQAQPGDILAFGDPAYHVAIYLGNDMMIAAPEPGEKVKIQSVYQTPSSIRRVIGTDPVSAGTSGGTAGVAQYQPLFSQNESRYGLPAGLLAAVAQTESGGNASAVSKVGAEGLMQLMPTTAQGLGVNPWDPAQAVQGAAQLLSGYLTRFGSVPLALAAYNAGPGAVEQYGGVPPYAETQNYVRKITGLMVGAAA